MSWRDMKKLIKIKQHNFFQTITRIGFTENETELYSMVCVSSADLSKVLIEESPYVGSGLRGEGRRMWVTMKIYYYSQYLMGHGMKVQIHFVMWIFILANVKADQGLSDSSNVMQVRFENFPRSANVPSGACGRVHMSFNILNYKFVQNTKNRAYRRLLSLYRIGQQNAPIIPTQQM